MQDKRVKRGDRRSRSRFDVVGDLTGVFDAVMSLTVKNIGRGGALIHSSVPLPSNSQQPLTFEADGREIRADVRVCHVRSDVSARGERRYLIGVEFTAMTPELAEEIDRWVAAQSGAAEV